MRIGIHLDGGVKIGLVRIHGNTGRRLWLACVMVEEALLWVERCRLHVVLGLHTAVVGALGRRTCVYVNSTLLLHSGVYCRVILLLRFGSRRKDACHSEWLWPDTLRVWKHVLRGRQRAAPSLLLRSLG